MRSRADVRRAAEWTLRGERGARLAGSRWRALHQRSPGAESRRVATAALSRTLDDATRDDRIDAIDVEVDSMPSPAHRALLAALRGAAVAVPWHGTPPALGL